MVKNTKTCFTFGENLKLEFKVEIDTCSEFAKDQTAFSIVQYDPNCRELKVNKILLYGDTDDVMNQLTKLINLHSKKIGYKIVKEGGEPGVASSQVIYDGKVADLLCHPHCETIHGRLYCTDDVLELKSKRLQLLDDIEKAKDVVIKLADGRAAVAMSPKFVINLE